MPCLLGWKRSGGHENRSTSMPRRFRDWLYGFYNRGFRKCGTTGIHKWLCRQNIGATARQREDSDERAHGSSPHVDTKHQLKAVVMAAAEARDLVQRSVMTVQSSRRYELLDVSCDPRGNKNGSG